MKKIFTLAAAVLASLSLWATDVVKTYTFDNTADFANDWHYVTEAANNTITNTGGTTGVTIGSTNNVTFDQTNLLYFSFGTSNKTVSITSAQKFGEVSAIEFNWIWSDNSKPTFTLQLVDTVNGEETILTTIYNALQSKNGFADTNNATTYAYQDGDEGGNYSKATTSLSGVTKYRIVVNPNLFSNNTGGYIKLSFVSSSTNKQTALDNLKITHDFCEAPELTVSPTEGTGFVGDPIDIAVTSKNQSKPINADVTVDGVPGEYGTDYTFSVSTGLVQATPLKAGTFVITFSQASNGTYCAAEESATFVISEKTPVASVTIDGPAAGFVGQELTYTATAEGATAYQWLVDGVDANTNAATFKYTAVKGTHSIVCKARNEFNAENEWIASDPIALTVTSLYGQLIAADAETGSGNIDKNITATGIVGGTVHQKSQKNAKLGSSGHYFSLTLAAGSFLAGDTVKVVVTPEYSTDKEAYSAPTQLKISTAVDNSNLIGESDTKVIDPASSDDLYFDIVLTEGASTIYLARDGSICKQNPIVKSISVIRPKAVDHVDVALVGAAIDGYPLPASYVNQLITLGSLTITNSFVNAPVVAFVKHTDTYYEGETEPVSTNDSIKVTATEVEGKWQAQATIGENTYTINLAKAASFTVHYMDGATELGTENVAANGTVANYAQYQELQLATFEGWYQDVNLTIEAVLTAPITAETYLYAKFTYTYATSINIEQWIIDNGKDSANTVALINLIGSQSYAHNLEYVKGNLELDSLTDKTDRNEPYLGLKVKKSGSMINFRVAEGQYAKVKFGAIKSEKPQVSINGGDYADMTITDSVYTYEAEGEEALISIKTAGNNAVVFKQIMINEPIQDVDLPKESTGIEDVAAEVKAVKVIREGQVLIIRDGKTYNALGAEVK